MCQAIYVLYILSEFLNWSFLFSFILNRDFWKQKSGGPRLLDQTVMAIPRPSILPGRGTDMVGEGGCLDGTL
jgi:hypothetical protein